MRSDDGQTFWADGGHSAIPDDPFPREAIPFDLNHTVKQTRKLIMRQPKRAVHADGVHSDILKALVRGSFPHHLTLLFNLCNTFQVTPVRWNFAITTLIPKTAENSTADCRPISIVPLFRSLYEKSLLQHLSPHLSRLHPAQIGFVAQESTLTHIDNLHKSRAPFKVLIDYSKAFDSPTFHHLRQSWRDFNLPPWLCRILASLYTREMSCILTVNGCHSDKIHRTKGIFQGTVLSPHLFNIFTDDLVRRLNPHYPERKTLLAYADDHVLICNTLAEAKNYLKTIVNNCLGKSPRIENK